MRLVDIDELELQEYEPQNDLAYAAGWNDCVDTVKNNICDIPAVDAVPVEWLKELLLSTDDDVDKVEFAWIMREWQKEQEAR